MVYGSHRISYLRSYAPNTDLKTQIIPHAIRANTRILRNFTKYCMPNAPSERLVPKDS